MDGIKCPGCGYVRKAVENVPDWQCPKCDIAYNKHPANHDKGLSSPQKIQLSKKSKSKKNRNYIKDGVVLIVIVILTSLYVNYLYHLPFYKNHMPRNIYYYFAKTPEEYNRYMEYAKAFREKMLGNNKLMHKYMKKYNEKSRLDFFMRNKINLNNINQKLDSLIKKSEMCTKPCKEGIRKIVMCDKYLYSSQKILKKVNRLRRLYNVFAKAKFSKQQIKITMEIAKKANGIIRKNNYIRKYCSLINVQPISTKPASPLSIRNFNIISANIIFKKQAEARLAEKCANSCLKTRKGDASCLALFFSYNNDRLYHQYLASVNKYGFRNFTTADREKMIKIKSLVKEINQYTIVKNICSKMPH